MLVLGARRSRSMITRPALARGYILLAKVYFSLKYKFTRMRAGAARLQIVTRNDTKPGFVPCFGVRSEVGIGLLRRFGWHLPTLPTSNSPAPKKLVRDWRSGSESPGFFSD